VPDTTEWFTLFKYLGGYSREDIFVGSLAGGHLKEVGTTHWQSPNGGADNSSGFSAMPAGDRNPYDGSFYDLGYYTFFWSSTGSSTGQSENCAWYDNLNYENGSLGQMFYYKSSGYSVRCLKD